MNILQAKKYYLPTKAEYKFSYSPLGKALENQLKTIGTQGKKISWSFKNFKTSRKWTKTKINWRNFSKRFGTIFIMLTINEDDKNKAIF